MNTKHILFALVSITAMCSAYAAEPVPPSESQSASARWQIFQGRIGAIRGDNERFESENTILLDSKTGKTWLLWTTSSGYTWVELPSTREFAQREPSMDTPKEEAEQDGTGQPATGPESKSEDSEKPQPEAEEPSR